jgi:hypothetical protein
MRGYQSAGAGSIWYQFRSNVRPEKRVHGDRKVFATSSIQGDAPDSEAAAQLGIVVLPGAAEWLCHTSYNPSRSEAPTFFRMR